MSGIIKTREKGGADPKGEGRLAQASSEGKELIKRFLIAKNP